MNIQSLTRHAAGITAFCALLAVPTLGQAATVYLVGDGYAQGSESFNLTAPVPVAVNPTGAGGFTGHIGLTNPPTTPIFFWCVELSQTFSFGTVYNNYTFSPLGNTLISQLFTEVGGSAALLSGPPSATKTINSAAFQLALWEILYEGGTYGGLNVSTGNFKATGDAAAIAQANIWLAGLSALSPATTALFSLHSASNQDFITDTPPPPGLLIPEPASLPLLGVGLLAVIFMMRRRTHGQVVGG